MVTAGRWGKTERETRATYPVSHLGRGRPVEVSPRRRAAVGGGAWGGSVGGAVECKEEESDGWEVRGGAESGTGLYLKARRGGVLTVYFGAPSMFITLWFGFDYGTNPPLGTLII
jgi:hypothetical protein